MEKDYYEIYKKYDKLVNIIDHKVNRINNEIIFLKKTINNLNNYEYDKKSKKKFIISSILLVLTAIFGIFIVINPITISILSLIQSIIISMSIYSIVLCAVVAEAFCVINNIPQKSDNIGVKGIENEIKSLEAEKNNLINEYNSIHTIKKDIDELVNHYQDLSKKEYQYCQINKQRKKFR